MYQRELINRGSLHLFGPVDPQGNISPNNTWAKLAIAVSQLEMLHTADMIGRDFELIILELASAYQLGSSRHLVEREISPICQTKWLIAV